MHEGELFGTKDRGVFRGPVVTFVKGKGEGAGVVSGVRAGYQHVGIVDVAEIDRKLFRTHHIRVVE